MKSQISKNQLGSVKEVNEKNKDSIGAVNDYEDLQNQGSALTDRDANIKALQDDVGNVHKVSLDTLRDQIFKMNKVIDSLPANNNVASQNALPIPDKQSENRLSNISNSHKNSGSNQQHISSPSLATTNQTDEQMQRHHLQQISNGVPNNAKVGSKRAIRSNQSNSSVQQLQKHMYTHQGSSNVAQSLQQASRYNQNNNFSNQTHGHRNSSKNQQ